MTEHKNTIPGDAPAQQDDAGEAAGLNPARLRELVDMPRDAADSREVSPARARRAADAVELMLLDV